MSQPGGEIAPRHVAVARGQGPARHQAEGDAALPEDRAACVLLEIEKAEVVLPSLADDRLRPLLGAVREQAVQFPVDLALKVPSVCRKPDRAAVAARPRPRRRYVPKGLADPGPRLGEHDVGFAGRLGRREGRRERSRIDPLLRTRLGAVPQKALEFVFRLVGRDGIVAGRRWRRALVPLGQPFPDREALAYGVRADVGLVDTQGPQRVRRPFPAGGRETAGGRNQTGIVSLVGEPGQQAAYRLQQRHGRVLQRAGRGKPQGPRDPGRRGQAEPGGTNEREQLQHVQGLEAPDGEAARDARPVTDDGGFFRDSSRRVLDAEFRDLAIGSQPDRAALAHDDDGRSGNGIGVVGDGRARVVGLWRHDASIRAGPPGRHAAQCSRRALWYSYRDIGGSVSPSRRRRIGSQATMFADGRGNGR